MMSNELEEFTKKFPKIKVNDKTIEETMSYRENSIVWFLQHRLEFDHMPPIFPNMDKINKAIKQNIILPRNKAKEFLIRRILEKNERIKQKLSKNKRKELQFNTENRILYLVPANRTTIKQDKIYVNRLNDVINKVDESKEISQEIITFDALTKAASRDLSNHPTFLYKYCNKEICKIADKESKKLSKKWEKIKKDIKFDSQREMLIFQNYLPALDFTFSKEFIEIIISSYEILHKILRENKINCVILDGFGSIPERSMIRATYDLNIPCLRLQHGFRTPINNRWLYPENCYACMFNQEIKESIVENGGKKENIFVTGATFLGKLPEKTKKSNLKKQVLFCTNSLVEESIMEKNKYFKIVEQILSELKRQNTEIIIKMHPSERYQNLYKKIIKKLNIKNIKIYQNIPQKETYNLISNSDMLISFYSTIILEANLMGIPTLEIDYEEQRDMMDLTFGKDKAVVMLDPEKPEIIEEYLNNKKKIDLLKKERKALINRAFYKIDGKVEERVLNVIKNLIKTQQSSQLAP